MNLGLTQPPRERLKVLPTACFLVSVSVFLYLRTFLLPRTPIYQGDNAPVFLLEARRILEGEVIYRDFFQFTFPGTQLLYSILFRLFGIRAWIASATLVLVGTALAGLSLVISRQLARESSVFLPGALFVALAFGSSLDATHHWYSTLAIMGGLAVLTRRRSPLRVASSGALCGLASCFTQSRGLMVALGLAAFLIWEARKQRVSWPRLAWAEACLGLGFLGVVAPLIAHYGLKVGARRFVYCVFTFVLKHYAAYGRNNLQVYMVDVPTYSSWLNVPAVVLWLFIHLLSPLVFLLVFVRSQRGSEALAEQATDRWVLISVVGFASFLSVALAPNWTKVSTASLPALILLVGLVRCSQPLDRFIRGLLWVVAVGAAVFQSATTQGEGGRRLDTPVGRVAVADPEREEKYSWLLERTRAGDFFFEAADTDVYFLLGLRNPTQVSFVSPTDYTRPEQVPSALEALERCRVRFILWSVELDLPEERRRAEDHLAPLRAYVRSHYRVAKTFADGAQIWERVGFGAHDARSTGAVSLTFMDLSW